MKRHPFRIAALVSLAWAFAAFAGGSYETAAQSAQPVSDVTFTKHIAPILQRSCQRCHRPDGGAPMPLLTYEQVRPWARAMKQRTGLGPKAGVMPPWFVEKNIGIQGFKDDPSLSDDEIATIARWADGGAPRGNPADLPKLLDFNNADRWQIGEPDLILESAEVLVPGVAPDKWGSLGLVPTGLTEDRYVSAVEVREVNDIPPASGTSTVGGRYVFHHMTYSSIVPGEGGAEAAEGGGRSWPIHEVGRNPDIFPPEYGRLLAKGSSLALSAYHLHANGRDTKAKLQFAFKFFPKGYQPQYRRSSLILGNGIDLDVKPDKAGQELHSYATLAEHTKIIAFEPHLHAPGVRMCLEAIWGHNILTLNCVGYDHNWVKQYVYEDDTAPLLPKGTIVHLIGFLDTTKENKNPADSRNWAGGGRRSISNMFIDLGYSVSLTEEQFQAEMAKRRAKMKTRNDYDIGCPLCWAPPVQATPATATRVPGEQ
jgi:mono/diheme cytochrome c family protein